MISGGQSILFVNEQFDFFFINFSFSIRVTVVFQVSFHRCLILKIFHVFLKKKPVFGSCFSPKLPYNCDVFFLAFLFSKMAFTSKVSQVVTYSSLFYLLSYLIEISWQRLLWSSRNKLRLHVLISFLCLICFWCFLLAFVYASILYFTNLDFYDVLIF